ncbi:hypothetical protein B566_EDAN011146 [Ephemera danica]|nr:hypothetical protein B566_EDAN011146 [Ephemera danica]
MRYVQFTSANGGPQRLGVQLTQGGDIIDISGVDSSVPNSLVEFLARGPALLEKTKSRQSYEHGIQFSTLLQLFKDVQSSHQLSIDINLRKHLSDLQDQYLNVLLQFSGKGLHTYSPPILVYLTGKLLSSYKATVGAIHPFYLFIVAEQEERWHSNNVVFVRDCEGRFSINKIKFGILK